MIKCAGELLLGDSGCVNPGSDAYLDQTLLCGDLFTRVGNGPAITESDIVEPSIKTEDLFHYTSLGPTTGSTIRRLADLKPKVLAAMHGASFSGDGAAALKTLGDHYEARLRMALPI